MQTAYGTIPVSANARYTRRTIVPFGFTAVYLFCYFFSLPFCRRPPRWRAGLRVGRVHGGRGWRRSRTAGAAHRETARGHRAEGRLRAVHVPVARLSQARAPVQRPVQAAHTHEGALGREAQQMHGELTRSTVYSVFASWQCRKNRKGQQGQQPMPR